MASGYSNIYMRRLQDYNTNYWHINTPNIVLGSPSWFADSSEVEPFSEGSSTSVQVSENVSEVSPEDCMLVESLTFLFAYIPMMTYTYVHI